MPNTDPLDAALARMALDDLRALWAAMAEGRFESGLTPRERLAAWYRRERRARFLDRIRRLPLDRLGSVWLRVAAGEDVDADEFAEPPPPTQPAPDGAGLPQEGPR